MASLLLRNLRDVFSRELKVRAAQNGRTTEEEHRRILEGALGEPILAERQRQTVAKRLNQLLRMLNDGGRGRPEMAIPRMAELLGLNTAGGLEAYFYGEDEAPFDLLDRITETFGLRPEWMKFGRYEPFDVRQYTVRGLHLPKGLGTRYESLASLMEALEPEAIFFVRSLGENGSATIFLQRSDWKYEGFYDGWHVSDEVGATGEAQLFELWKLLKSIGDDSGIARKVAGRQLPAEVYLSLCRGEVFPGSVLHQQRFYSHWHDDFTDVHQVMPIARSNAHEAMPKNGEGYAGYGQGFQQAQARVRQCLKHEKEDQERRRRETSD